MLDDIIELAIDLLGDILEAVLSSKRKQKSKPQKQKKVLHDDPWAGSDQAAPWEK